ASGLELRDAGLELQHAQVGDDGDRLVARAREAAGVVVALDDHAVDGRRQRRVALHFARAPQRGLGLRHAGLRQVALRRRRTPGRVRGVEALFRDGAGVEQLLRALVLDDGVGERRLGRLDAGV